MGKKYTQIPQNEINRIIGSFYIYNIPKGYQNLIMDAITSLNNGEFTYDGATGDIEWWTSVYEPSSLVHDYLWATGQGGYESDQLFHKLMVMYRVPGIQRAYRYYGVRLGWFVYYKWHHMLKGNVNPIKKEYKDLLHL